MTVIEAQTMNMICSAAKKIAGTSLTERDIFAMAALNGIISRGYETGKSYARHYAETAYSIADAMLEVRRYSGDKTQNRDL